MKKRVVSFLLSIVLIFSLSTFSHASEIYSPYYPLKWSNSIGSSVTLYWYDYNCSTQNSTIASYLSYGMSYWNVFSGVTIINAYNSTYGCIAHSIPTITWWEAYFQNDFFALLQNTGLTFLYDTGNMQVTQANVSLSTGLIKNATIFYSPESIFSDYTAVNYKCLVAHEVGHALGFGHENYDSIMLQGTKNYQALTNGDISRFNAKYN